MTREETILHYLPDVNRLAGWFYKNYAPIVELEDLKAEAAWAAIRAIDKYDPNKGKKLWSWINTKVVGALKDYHRRVDIRPRSMIDGTWPMVQFEDEFEIPAIGKSPEEIVIESFAATPERIHRVTKKHPETEPVATITLPVSILDNILLSQTLESKAQMVEWLLGRYANKELKGAA